MKLLTFLLSTLLLMGAGLLNAQSAQPTPPPAKTTKPAAKPAKKGPAPLTVPPDAVQVSPGLYRWTDKDGKGWMYRRTPFGVSRWQEDSEDTKQKAIVQQTTAVEQGDSVRFERASPFGKQTWVKKKTDLDETEQKIWARQRDNSAASRTAEKE
jgi:hypothetical protein